MKKCTIEQRNSVLSTKLSRGDLIAQEAKYHAKCLMGLYNEFWRSEMSEESITVQIYQKLVFSKLVNSRRNAFERFK